MVSKTIKEALNVYNANEKAKIAPARDIVISIKNDIETNPDVYQELLCNIEKTGIVTFIDVTQLVKDASLWNMCHGSQHISEFITKGPFEGYCLYIFYTKDNKPQFLKMRFPDEPIRSRW
jgi:hypothetical protein